MQKKYVKMHKKVSNNFDTEIMEHYRTNYRRLN